jgi:F1F0 ATPase subunit 2
MRETSILAFALFAGILLATIFYGGLWWTVRRVVSSRSSGAWLIGSFLLRATIAVSGFYFVSREDWRSLVTCLLGFVIGRIAVTQLTQAAHDTKARIVQGRCL